MKMLKWGRLFLKELVWASELSEAQLTSSQTLPLAFFSSSASCQITMADSSSIIPESARMTRPHLQL